MTDTRQTRGGGDPDEIRRAQRGDRLAFLHLYERHAPLTWRLALVAGRDRATAEAAVVGAFAQVLGRSDRRDSQRFAPVGAQLLRSARESAIEQAGRIEAAGLEVAGDDEHEDSVRAFDRLPEAWRSVLWLDQVERCPLATTALVLGGSGPGTTDLATRALGGFREQLVQLQVHPHLRPDCRQATLRLSAYVACALPSRDTLRVRRHLDRCEDCRQRLDELDDVTTHLPGALPALPIALESLAMGAWFARAHEGSGPIGLRLPGGSLAPAWVERSLAGATAAVVSLGITAAVLLNARDGGNPVPTESAAARGEGEQALADDSPIDDGATDGSTDVVSIPPIGSSDGLTSADTAPSTPSSGADPTPEPAPSGATPRGFAAPAPSAPSPSSPPSAPAPTPPPPDDPGGSSDSTSDPVDDVVGAVEDVVDEVCGGLGPVCDALPTEPSLPQIPGL